MGFTKTPGWRLWSRGGHRMLHGIHPASTKLLACLPVLIGLALPSRSAMAQDVGQRFRDCRTCPKWSSCPLVASPGGHTL